MATQADAMVLFGGSGDLARRMLLPSLYFLDADGFLPEGFRIVAVARADHARDDFVRLARQEMEARPERLDEAAWTRFAARLNYVAADAASPEGLRALGPRLKAERPIFYLALSPSLYPKVCAALAAAGLAGEATRIVLEKPVGRDLESSRAINAAVGAVFAEDRIFRIDHYLGKETVQNLIALRFANTLFEPLWNNLTVDHVRITVAETAGVGERWPYYDEYGALRDMLQNHVLQLLCLVAMEPPSDLDPDSVRNEKVKVLRSLRPFDPEAAAEASARGQYVAGAGHPAYAAERGRPSGTETFVALRADIDNWRWAGVPFFLRTGKRLAEKRTQIAIQFKGVPHSIFGEGAGDLTANRLVLDLQPDEDIELTLMNKSPGIARSGKAGGGMRLQSLPLSLSLARAYSGPGARRRIAYERLLLDVIDGVSTLFVRRDEVEAAWRWIDGIADAWAAAGIEPQPYPAGSWGPPGAAALIGRSGRRWDG